MKCARRTGTINSSKPCGRGMGRLVSTAALRFASQLVAASLLARTAVVSTQGPNQGLAPTKYVVAPSRIAERYIVVLTQAATPLPQTAATLAARHRALVVHHYASIRAFVAQMSEADARMLATDPGV